MATQFHEKHLLKLDWIRDLHGLYYHQPTDIVPGPHHTKGFALIGINLMRGRFIGFISVRVSLMWEGDDSLT